MVKVSKHKAAALLVALGLNPKAVERYGPKELQDKLAVLKDVTGVAESVAKLKDKELANVGAAVLSATGEGKPVEVTDDEPGATAAKDKLKKVDKPKAGSEDSPPRPKKVGAKSPPAADPPAESGKEKKTVKTATKTDGKGKKVDKTDKKAAKPAAKADKPAPKKEATAKDEWGYRLNTRAARINAAITDKPRTAKEIGAAAKYDKPFHGQLRGLVAKGFVEYDADAKTYVRAGAKPAKKKKVTSK